MPYAPYLFTGVFLPDFHKDTFDKDLYSEAGSLLKDIADELYGLGDPNAAQLYSESEICYTILNTRDCMMYIIDQEEYCEQHALREPPLLNLNSCGDAA